MRCALAFTWDRELPGICHEIWRTLKARRDRQAHHQRGTMKTLTKADPDALYALFARRGSTIWRYCKCSKLTTGNGRANKKAWLRCVTFRR